MKSNVKKQWTVLIISLILMLGGSLLGGWIHTGAGSAVIKDIKYAGTNGFVWNARLYIPNGVTNENPAPGALVVHGGDASNDIIANTSLELARRGYVVLAFDVSGHGYSDAPRNAYNHGAPDALKYLRSLDIVDTDNIAMVGMSLGGMAISTAAEAYPDGYNSLFYMDSQCFDAETNMCPESYRNIMLNWGMFDEYTQDSFKVSSQSELLSCERVMKTFGVTEPVEVGKVYGSIDDGTARVLTRPMDTHVSSLDSVRSIGNAINWVQMTTEGETSIPASNQIWRWKLLGTTSALIGVFVFMFGIGGLLLNTAYFKPLAGPVPEFKGLKGTAWWIGVVITTALGPIIHGWLYSKGGTTVLVANSLWPQNQTNGYMLPTLVLGLITFILIFVNHFMTTKKQGATAYNYGLTWEGKGLDWGMIAKSMLLVLCILIPAYLILGIIYTVLKVDFRFSFIALRVMTPIRFKAFLGYLIPFSFFYFVFMIILHGFLRVKNGKGSMALEMITNVLIWAVGIYVFDIIKYSPIFFGDSVMVASQTGTVLRAFPYLVVWPIYALLSTYFFRKTGKIYVSAFLLGIFATWYIACNSAFAVIP